MSSHPLYSNSTTAFLGLLGAFGLGVGLMTSAHPFLFYLGMTICYTSVAATLWLYWDGFKDCISKRSIDFKVLPAVAFVLVQSIVPTYLVFDRLNPANEDHANSSRVIVDHFEIVPIDKTDPKSDYVVNVYMANTGKVFGYIGSTTSWLQFSDQEIPQDQLEKKMGEITNQAITYATKKHPTQRQQIEVGEKPWITTWRMKPDDWNAVVSGKKYLYVFIAITSSDEGFTDKRFWVNEYCGSPINGSSTVKLCAQRTFLHG